MEAANGQYADPAVTRLKFDREIAGFKQLKQHWRERGVFLIEESYPTLEFLFTAPKINPQSVCFCVRMDFTNYDVEPPSLKFIDPFSRRLLKRNEMRNNFLLFKVTQQEGALPGQLQVIPQDLLQGYPEDPPFLCIRGVKEYHDNPVHTGDPWLLYRTGGEGTLHYLLDQLYKHSVQQISGYQVNLTFNYQFTHVP